MNDSEVATPASELWNKTEGDEPVSIEDDSESLNFKLARFIRLCWAKRLMVFSILALGILISLLYALSLPNIYTSTTTLMPPGNTSPYSSMMSMLSSGSAAAGLSGEALGLETPGELFVSILGSRSVLDGLIQRFDLVHHYKSKILEDARTALTGATSIQSDRKSGIISISVKAVDPVLASNLAQGYVVELNRVVTENSTSEARRERIFLEERLKEVKQDLDDSSKALSQFSAKSGAIDMPSQAKSMVEVGLKLQAELIEGHSQLAALRQTYSEDNSRVRAVEARNAELQRQLDAMGGLSQGSGSHAEAHAGGYPSAQELPALGLTYYDLERKVKVDEELWEALTKEYEAAKVDEAKQIPTVRVLDAANVPQRKSAPVRSRIMLLGALLSLIAGFVAVFATTFWAEMDPEDEPKKLLTEVVRGMMSIRRRA